MPIRASLVQQSLDFFRYAVWVRETCAAKGQFRQPFLCILARRNRLIRYSYFRSASENSTMIQHRCRLTQGAPGQSTKSRAISAGPLRCRSAFASSRRPALVMMLVSLRGCRSVDPAGRAPQDWHRAHHWLPKRNVDMIGKGLHTGKPAAVAMSGHGRAQPDRARCSLSQPLQTPGKQARSRAIGHDCHGAGCRDRTGRSSSVRWHSPFFARLLPVR